MDREELEWYHDIQDPWDWVDVFEKTIAEAMDITCAACDSNSMQ